MTTFTNFTPSPNTPFQFQPTLDGTVYYATVNWNLYGQRYYLLLTDSDGNVIFNQALVGSPVGLVLETLAWSGGFATAVTALPHGFSPGLTVALTISGASPDGYNGDIEALVIDAFTFTYPLASDPGGAATQAGSVFSNISLTAGYFDSTLVFREANAQFEVSP